MKLSRPCRTVYAIAKLKRLRIVHHHQWMEGMGKFHEEFGPLAEVVEANRPNGLVQRASPISGLKMGIY